jgi:hypothetical protein
MGVFMPGGHSKTAEIIFALLLAFISWSLSDMPIIYRCLMWAVAWALLLLGSTTFARVSRLPAVIKLLLSVGLTGCLAAVSYSPIMATWHKEQAAVTSRTLEAPESEQRFPDGQVQFQIGTDADGTRFNWTGGNGPIMDLVGDKLSIQRKSGKLLLTTQVRDQQGKIVVQVTDNEWQVSPDSSICWDKNYTRNSFEVKDGRGRVVLQVILLPESVRIQGEWWHEDGNGVRIMRPFPYDRVGTGPIFVKMTKIYHPDDPAIEPMFQYPSKDHWGVYADWINPQEIASVDSYSTNKVMRNAVFIYAGLVLVAPLSLLALWRLGIPCTALRTAASDSDSVGSS